MDDQIYSRYKIDIKQKGSHENIGGREEFDQYVLQSDQGKQLFGINPSQYHGIPYKRRWRQ